MDKLIKYCLVVEFTLAYEDVIKEAVSLAETHFIYQDRMWRIYDMMIQVCVCVCVYEELPYALLHMHATGPSLLTNTHNARVYAGRHG
jgi:hypothetical protein